MVVEGDRITSVTAIGLDDRRSLQFRPSIVIDATDERMLVTELLRRELARVPEVFARGRDLVQRR